MMNRQDTEEPHKEKIERLVIALLLVPLCLAVFIIFMRQNKEVPSDTVPTNPPQNADVSNSGASKDGSINDGQSNAGASNNGSVNDETPDGNIPNDGSPDDVSLPYVLDVMLAIEAGGLGCEISEPEEDGSITKYELIFEQHTDSGSIEFKTDGNGHVISCTLKRRYLYSGEPTNKGEVGDKIRAEYARRLAADKRLLDAFVPIVVSKLDFDSELSSTKLNKLLEKLTGAYENRESLFATELPIVIIADSERDDIYTIFTATITLMDKLGK